MLKTIFKKLPIRAQAACRAVFRCQTFAAGSLPLSWPEFPSHLPSSSSNPLNDYFESNTKGPGIWKWKHYFDIYHRHLAKFVGQAPRVMEIGIYSGGSLGMWQHYFGKGCQIIGVDIAEACKTYERDGIRVFIGDQADRSFWRRLKREIGEVDIILDDGGHEPHQQIVTFEETLPMLAPNGVYICEDIHTSDNRFLDYLAGFNTTLFSSAAHRISEGKEGHSATPTDTQRNVESIHFYPYMVVVERRKSPLTTLSSERHGTEWQPFLNL
jgi:hypothetical protein